MRGGPSGSLRIKQQSFFGNPSGPPHAGGLACSAPLRVFVHLPDVADTSHHTASSNGLGHRQRSGREPVSLPNPASLLRKITLAMRPFVSKNASIIPPPQKAGISFFIFFLRCD